MKIQYVARKFNAATQVIIDQANEIIDEYEAKGYTLTLRQIFYQFVSRDLIANKQTEYKRLGSILNDARLDGQISWTAIEDRTRSVRELSHWADPAEIVDTCARSFLLDKWANQEFRPEVWIEKDALVGVFECVCQRLDVPLLSCRGYTSQSEMWRAARRMRRNCDGGQAPMVFHFGDHDPSGIDMSRDIKDRLNLFGADSEKDLEFQRLALNMDQVDEFSPPPNPAKITDSRAQGYIAQFGGESWELDALDPETLAGLVEDHILRLRDEDKYQEVMDQQDEMRKQLEVVSSNWSDVVTFTEENC